MAGEATQRNEQPPGSSNSTLGRFAIFSISLVLFVIACVGVVYARSPDNYHKGISPLLVALTAIDIGALLSVPGYLAESSGMNAQSLWKPYFAMWRLSILLMPGAIICLLLGSGESVKFGEVSTYNSIVDVLQVQSGNPFAALDGFVATNLTVAYIKVLKIPEDPNWAGTRLMDMKNEDAKPEEESISTIKQKILYSSWQYFESENPSVQGYKKKHPPDTMAYLIAAPIFARSVPCLRRFDSTTVCMAQNPIIGWAMQERDSLCSSLGMVACWKEELEILPMYGCVGDEGLCGRVVNKPTTYLREEVVNWFTSEGWVFAGGTADEARNGTLRNGSDANPVLWVDANDNPCIWNPQSCMKKWDLIGTLGKFLAIITILLIVATAAYDLHVDNQLRFALEYAY
eukprot:GEMP01046330.1.p1 GENE.GEMP01046330.1~~GEMP01046330.1.p1  ORF type:complete len:401 (+),score=61.38 GEMP01046330.1:236-1438(+)